MKQIILAISAILGLAAAGTADNVAVTIYNSNLGVISEVRSLDFKKGINRLAFTDVPSQIDAASVGFELTNPGRKVVILEQNYLYDLVSPDQMYSRYTDKKIELIDENGKVYQGTLLSYNGGAVVIREDNGRTKIVRLEKVPEVNFPDLPEGLVTRPTLYWLYSSDTEGKLESRISYQTGGLNWSAEYVGMLNADETKLDLSGWANINNESGKAYTDAKLKLIAGDIARIQPPIQTMYRADVNEGLAMKAAPGFEEKPFFDYHMYTLPRNATLANHETKQISLFDPARATVTKKYLFAPESKPGAVDVVIKFTNSTQSGLGMPLPMGRVRMFKSDTDGSAVLLGETQIQHTPKDEEMNLTVGTAFDVVAEDKIMDSRRVSSQVEERDMQIELRNRKTTDITVTIQKRLWGFWEILSSSVDYTKKDANTIEMNVPVKAGQTATVKLSVRFTNR